MQRETILIVELIAYSKLVLAEQEIAAKDPFETTERQRGH